MAKLKAMQTLIIELLKELRDDVETTTVPFVLESDKDGTIDVYAEDSEEGLVHYHIKVQDITVKKVLDKFSENDVADIATVEGNKVSNNEFICYGSLFYVFAGSEDKIIQYYDADFFRYTIKHILSSELRLTLD